MFMYHDKIRKAMMENIITPRDDPAGAFAVHGVAGMVGTLLVAFLMNPDKAGAAGLLYGGGMIPSHSSEYSASESSPSQHGPSF